jgi:phage shock protein A
MNNVTTTNGNGKKTSQTLPDTRIKAAELFIENFQRREDELDRTKEALDHAHVRLRELETEVEGLKRERVMLESRATSCMLERDQAVADRAVRETILASIQVLLVQAGVPRIVQLADDEGADNEDRH